MDLRARLSGDLHAAMLRVARAAEDRDELRRGLIEALAHLHSWREYERRQYELRTGTQIRGLADTGAEHALWVEALLLWRIVAEHHPEQLIELRIEPLLTGRVFPSEWLMTGANLCMVEWAAVPERIREESTPRAAHFRDWISGLPVLPAFGVAAHCLATLNSPPT